MHYKCSIFSPFLCLYSTVPSLDMLYIFLLVLLLILFLCRLLIKQTENSFPGCAALEKPYLMQLVFSRRIECVTLFTSGHPWPNSFHVQLRNIHTYIRTDGQKSLKGGPHVPCICIVCLGLRAADVSPRSESFSKGGTVQYVHPCVCCTPSRGRALALLGKEQRGVRFMRVL